MSDPVPAARTATCPDCGTVVRPDQERLCPTCGYPLAFLRATSEVTDFGPARQPGERLEATGIVRTETGPAVPEQDWNWPAPEQFEAGPGETVCSRCGEVNAADRTRCQRCGQILRPRATATLPAVSPAPPPAAAASSMSEWAPLIGAVLIAVLLVAGAILLAVLDSPETRGAGLPATGATETGVHAAGREAGSRT